MEEDKGYEEGRQILLVWDFDVGQILSASGVVAVIPDTDDICVTPLLDVNAVSYNCSNFTSSITTCR